MPIRIRIYPTGSAVRAVAPPFAPMVVLVARVEAKAICPSTVAIAPDPIAIELALVPASTSAPDPIHILLEPVVIASPA